MPRPRTSQTPATACARSLALAQQAVSTRTAAAAKRQKLIGQAERAFQKCRGPARIEAQTALEQARARDQKATETLDWARQERQQQWARENMPERERVRREDEESQRLSQGFYESPEMARFRTSFSGRP